MKRLFSTAAIAALAIGLAGCGPGDAPAGNGPDADPGGNGMGAMMADPENPFAHAEMQMDERMMAAVGSNPGDSWGKAMIQHHQGAIDMARIVLEHGPSAGVAAMARETIGRQQKDIDAIRRLVEESGSDRRSADLYRPAMMAMHRQMMAAKGADVSETFLRKMLEHHKGAVAMADVALASEVSGAIRTQVEKTRRMNQEDAKLVEAMLAAKPLAEARGQGSPGSGTRASSSAPASGEGAAGRTATGPGEPPSAPAPAPADPHAGHDMNSM